LPSVTVNLNGQGYRLQCGENEEDRVRMFAEYLDGHVRKVAAELGQIGDARLFMLAALNICDELFTVKARLGHEDSPETAALIRLLTDASERIERATARIEGRDDETPTAT
jgi:cell division protein ZapA